MLATVRRMSSVDIAAATACVAAAYAVKIVRWRTMLMAVAPPPGDAADSGFDPGLAVQAQIFVGSIALNNLLPLRAGDAARVFAFQHQLGRSTAAVLGILVLEKVLDLLVLLAVLGLVVATIPEHTWPTAVSTPLAAGVGAAAAAGLLVVAFARPLARLLEMLAARLDHAVLRPVLVLGRGTLETIGGQTRGLRLASLAGMTVAAWLVEGGLYVVTAHAMSISQPLAAGYLAFALATLSTLLPSSPGYFGTFHVFAMLAVGVFGAGASDAAAFAIVTHLLHWLPMTLVGVAALFSLSLRTAAANQPGPG